MTDRSDLSFASHFHSAAVSPKKASRETFAFHDEAAQYLFGFELLVSCHTSCFIKPMLEMERTYAIVIIA